MRWEGGPLHHAVAVIVNGQSGNMLASPHLQQVWTYINSTLVKLGTVPLPELLHHHYRFWPIGASLVGKLRCSIFWLLVTCVLTDGT